MLLQLPPQKVKVTRLRCFRVWVLMSSCIDARLESWNRQLFLCLCWAQDSHLGRCPVIRQYADVMFSVLLPRIGRIFGHFFSEAIWSSFQCLVLV